MKWPVLLKRALAHAFIRKHRQPTAASYSFAAILVTKNTTIVRYNVSEKLQQPTKHAEMRCLAVRLSKMGAVMYVARSNRQGDPLNARPCGNCERAIRKAGITRIVYTNEDGTYSTLTF